MNSRVREGANGIGVRLDTVAEALICKVKERNEIRVRK